MKFSSFLLLVYFTSSLAYSATLLVTTQGNGHVSSNPPGILCGAACRESYDSGREITLNAISNGGAFKFWSGHCSGTQPICTFTLDSDKAVTAVFEGEVKLEHELTVSKSGDGQGTVSINPYGVTLGIISPYDVAKFPTGSNVTLTASAQPGSRFDKWTGQCDSTTSNSCTVTLTEAKTITAVFLTGSAEEKQVNSTSNATTAISNVTSNSTRTLTPEPLLPSLLDLTILKEGTGKGAVFLWPQGRMQQLCGSSENECKFTFTQGTSIVVQQLAIPGFSFEGWSGACSGLTECSFALDKPLTLIAKFEAAKNVQTNNSAGDKLNATRPIVPNATRAPPASGNYPLIVSQSAGGLVKSADGKIKCGEYNSVDGYALQSTQCNANYQRNSQVPLIAEPLKGWKFIGWGGACRGTEEASCEALIESPSLFIASTEVRAVFEPSKQTLEVSTNGENGMVTSIDYKINCPNICASVNNYGETVVLEAKPKGLATFEKWGGACANTRGSPCIVPMTSSKSVQAFFAGPPSRKKLSLFFNGPTGSTVTINSVDSNGIVPVKTCDNNCTVDFKHGSKVELMLTIGEGVIWQGFSGSCIGDTGNCFLSMDSDKTVTLSFEQAFFNLLTVEPPLIGVVVSNDGKIRCGQGASQCTYKFDTRLKPVLFFDFEGNSKGLFDSGCDATWKKLDNYYRPYEECVVDMKTPKFIKTKLSYAQEKFIVESALGELFNFPDYPGLKEFATREAGVPFQKALAAFKSGKAGKTIVDVKKWILANYDSFLKDSQIAKYMEDYDVETVRSALYDLFLGDVEKVKNSGWFKKDAFYAYLYDATKPPFTRGLKDWISMHKKGKTEYYAYLKTVKNSYYNNEGIKPFFEAPVQQVTPPAPPEQGPKISEIRPNKRLEIGMQTAILGERLNAVHTVLLDGRKVEFKWDSTKNSIVLPTVAWGVYDGVKEGSLGIVTVISPKGSDSKKIISNKDSIRFNFDGKEEYCFGAVGKACGGLFGVEGGESSGFLWRAGCEAEKNGKRVCRVAAGSIRHDNCCVRFPSGKWCGGPGTDGKPAEEFNHDGNCAAEWHEAFWDVYNGRAWEETFDVTKPEDLTPSGTRNGRYSPGEAKAAMRLCAPIGQEMREFKDVNFCCGTGRLNQWKKCE